jgi:hypothetical protein
MLVKLPDIKFNENSFSISHTTACGHRERERERERERHDEDNRQMLQLWIGNAKVAHHMTYVCII